MATYPMQGLTLKSLLENPDLLNPTRLPVIDGGLKKDGKKADESDNAYNGFSAFLGPNLWEKTVPFDGVGDMKLEYMDLDEFLDENPLETQSPQQIQAPNIDVLNGGQSHNTVDTSGNLILELPTGPSLDIIQGQHSPTGLPMNGTPTNSRLQSPGSVPGSPVSGEVNVDYSVSTSDVVLSSIPANELADGWPQDLTGKETYDPRKRAFSDEELRPQPMIKKSKKVFVPDEHKDIKYWSRRQKNNVAAKRSRDARRIKENQIALRAGYLEKENNQLKVELEKVRLENKELRNHIIKLENGVADSSA